jgi:hypothetical protein
LWHGRLLVVAEKDVVYNRFPIPLINRLEKHFLSTGTLLQGEQKRVYDIMQDWIKQFKQAAGRYLYDTNFVISSFA